MSAWHNAGKSHLEIEAELLAAVELAKYEYERAGTDIAHLCQNSLHQEHEIGTEAAHALAQYVIALHRFTEFVISGKTPEEGG